ncbi:winged helix-turn-helix domain-containing protein [Halovivax limisalsi]|uniref:winged helix-turn-helix domain-containing protein n=1 Tax=Halovivax limisalsi TaxID=1453760 RepID=UPI001FFD2582|nr:winged helix-turn-helix domain-containing protein [Halovivax limisalsi]
MSDFSILEFLDGHELDAFHAPPSTIAKNMDISKGTVQQRVRILNAAGLIEKEDETGGYYRITGLGRRYLDQSLLDEEKERLKAFDPDNV